MYDTYGPRITMQQMERMRIHRIDESLLRSIGYLGTCRSRLDLPVDLLIIPVLEQLDLKKYKVNEIVIV